MISGTAKGRRLRAPSGRWARPTADRVKEALFNVLRVEWGSWRVLDLFAGTGALGIEALSRGAREALFVEEDPRCAAAIQENLRLCRFSESGRVLRMEAMRFLSGTGTWAAFDAIFADPPYQKGLAEACLRRIEGGGWLQREGFLVVEHSRREPLPEKGDRLVRVDERTYGDTRISIYQWPEPERMNEKTMEEEHRGRSGTSG